MSDRRPGAEREPWMVMRASRGRGWGGEIRRARIFERLAERQHAQVVDDWPTFQRAIRGRRWQAWLPGRRPRPHLAASETAPPKWIERIVALSDPVAVAIYDDPVAQARALGIELSAARAEELTHRAPASMRRPSAGTSSRRRRSVELLAARPGRVIVGRQRDRGEPRSARSVARRAGDRLRLRAPRRAAGSRP